MVHMYVEHSQVSLALLLVLMLLPMAQPWRTNGVEESSNGQPYLDGKHMMCYRTHHACRVGMERGWLIPCHDKCICAGFLLAKCHQSTEHCYKWSGDWACTCYGRWFGVKPDYC